LFLVFSGGISNAKILIWLSDFLSIQSLRSFTRDPRNTLDEYLELHTLVESVQTADTLPYFIYRLIRGAYIFENLAYLELRYTPYLRTSEH
jgi:adenosine deaminase